MEDYFDANIALEGLTKFLGIDFFYDIDILQAHLNTSSMYIFQKKLLEVMHHNDFYHLDIVTRLADNNLTEDNMPNYYLFGKAILKYYNLEKELVEHVVNKVYPAEDDLKTDVQINTWWKMFYDSSNNSMEIKNKELDKDNLVKTLMILVSVLLEHGMEHGTAGRSFSSAYQLPLRVKETRADISELKDAKTFYYKNVLGSNALIFSQTALAMGYATNNLSKIVRKNYGMWSEHSYPDLGDYKAKMEAYQEILRAENSYYLAEYIPMSVRDID